MQKLYRVVCANFALSSKKPLTCDYKLEDNLEDAIIMLVGLGCKEFGIERVTKYLKIGRGVADELIRKFDKRKSKRFARKLKLVQNGMIL